MALEKKKIKKLKDIFDKILNQKISNHNKLKFNSTKNWDSLRHIQLILAIEKTFSLKIKTSDIYALSSFEKILKYLDKSA